MFCIMLRPWGFTFALTSAIVATLSVNEIRKEGLYFLLRSLLYKIELRAVYMGRASPGTRTIILDKTHSVAPWSGGGRGGGMPPTLLLRPVGKLSMLSEIVKVVDGGGGGGGI